MGIGVKRRSLGHRGVSLIEVLVVTGILSATLAIMLPMINQARMIAARQACVNKMRNLAQGVLFYEGFNGRLPVAGVVGPSDGNSFLRAGYDQNSGNQLSWIVLVLPFIGEDQLASQFEISKSATNQQHDAQSQSLASLVCPSDGGTVDRKFVSSTLGREFGVGNYAAFISPVHGEQQQHWAGALGGFKPGGLEGQPIRKIRDGLNKTMLLSEVRTNPFTGRDPRGAWALPWIGSTTLAADAHPVLAGANLNDIRNVPYVPDTSYPVDQVQRPNSQIGAVDQVSPCGQPLMSALSAMPCTRYPGYGRGFASAAPRSFHENGVNAAFLDGHIEFLSDETDHLIFARRVSVDDAAHASLN